MGSMGDFFGTQNRKNVRVLDVFVSGVIFRLRNKTLRLGELHRNITIIILYSHYCKVGGPPKSYLCSYTSTRESR